ncbi:MAG: 3-deoxy-7-phosphoheptulonate synthase, partial [Lentisphaeria bacterium]|nr:3-deoxy-7-phosphoheptulonate synthase [Lentisphaeria bacterium]
MIIILKKDAPASQLDMLTNWLKERNLQVHHSEGTSQTILGLIGNTHHLDIDLIKQMEIVEDVKRIQEPFKNANRKFHPLDTVVKVGTQNIGDGGLTVMAGPCSVESEEQIVTVARSVKASGATLLRGGAFKPRTSP